MAISLFRIPSQTIKTKHKFLLFVFFIITDNVKYTIVMLITQTKPIAIKKKPRRYRSIRLISNSLNSRIVCYSKCSRTRRSRKCNNNEEFTLGTVNLKQSTDAGQGFLFSMHFSEANVSS